MSKGKQPRNDWIPPELFGWFNCRVRLSFRNHYRACYSDITVMLWYNKDSGRYPWFIGNPGKTATLDRVLPSSQVMGLANND